MNDLLWRRALEGLEQPKKTPVLRVLEADARYIPVSTRRMVNVRDEGRCTHTDAGGSRCPNRENLDLSAIVPFSAGGRARAANLRLSCSEHR
ncbi:MAG: hypothetical protein HY074_17235 [Deltaproteobacteria bacterium]|nr:hypothetical protein [Deltaproteobacteria bacterium]